MFENWIGGIFNKDAKDVKDEKIKNFLKEGHFHLNHFNG